MAQVTVTKNDTTYYANTNGDGDPAISVTATSTGFTIANTSSSYSTVWCNDNGKTYTYVIFK